MYSLNKKICDLKQKLIQQQHNVSSA